MWRDANSVRSSDSWMEIHAGLAFLFARLYHRLLFCSKLTLQVPLLLDYNIHPAGVTVSLDSFLFVTKPSVSPRIEHTCDRVVLHKSLQTSTCQALIYLCNFRSLKTEHRFVRTAPRSPIPVLSTFDEPLAQINQRVKMTIQWNTVEAKDRLLVAVVATCDTKVIGSLHEHTVSPASVTHEHSPSLSSV